MEPVYLRHMNIEVHRFKSCISNKQMFLVTTTKALVVFREEAENFSWLPFISRALNREKATNQTCNDAHLKRPCPRPRCGDVSLCPPKTMAGAN